MQPIYSVLWILSLFFWILIFFLFLSVISLNNWQQRKQIITETIINKQGIPFIKTLHNQVSTAITKTSIILYSLRKANNLLSVIRLLFTQSHIFHINDIIKFYSQIYWSSPLWQQLASRASTATQRHPLNFIV